MGAANEDPRRFGMPIARDDANEKTWDAVVE
jgi:hypothetical protein